MLISMLAKFARENTILPTQYTIFINVNHNSFKMSISGGNGYDLLRNVK